MPVSMEPLQSPNTTRKTKRTTTPSSNVTGDLDVHPAEAFSKSGCEVTLADDPVTTAIILSCFEKTSPPSPERGWIYGLEASVQDKTHISLLV